MESEMDEHLQLLRGLELLILSDAKRVRERIQGQVLGVVTMALKYQARDTVPKSYRQFSLDCKRAAYQREFHDEKDACMAFFDDDGVIVWKMDENQNSTTTFSMLSSSSSSFSIEDTLDNDNDNDNITIPF